MFSPWQRVYYIVISTLLGCRETMEGTLPRSLGSSLRFPDDDSRGKKLTFLEQDLYWAFHGHLSVSQPWLHIKIISELWKLLMPWFEARSIKSKLWYESRHDFFFFVNALAVIICRMLRTTSFGIHEVTLLHIFLNLLTLLWGSYSLAKQAYLPYPENTTKETHRPRRASHLSSIRPDTKIFLLLARGLLFKLLISLWGSNLGSTKSTLVTNSGIEK